MICTKTSPATNHHGFHFSPIISLSFVLTSFQPHQTPLLPAPLLHNLSRRHPPPTLTHLHGRLLSPLSPSLTCCHQSSPRRTLLQTRPLQLPMAKTRRRSPNTRHGSPLRTIHPPILDISRGSRNRQLHRRYRSRPCRRLRDLPYKCAAR